MELASTVFEHILGPLAAFPDCASPGPTTGHGITGAAEHNGGNHDHDEFATEWDKLPDGAEDLIPSSISREQTFKLTWRVDGADVDGRRIFATPGFATGRPPLRVDIYLPPLEDYSRSLRALLQPEKLVYTAGSDVAKLPISRHVLRALESWSSTQPDFETQYSAVPFGSQILVTEVAAASEYTAAGICLCPDYDVEQAMLTVDELQGMWNLSVEQWPPALELDDLRFVRQLHEAISLVTISKGAPTTDGSGTEYVFKSLTRDQRYLYNELRMLLTLAPHPNLIPRPLHVVTKRARFGGKPGVCGFLLEYYPLGSLKQRLLRPDLPIPKRQTAKWAKQIGQALMHINAMESGFYPDLKPDNVVLRDSNDGEDVVLLDLEQRGGWYSWSPPEILYIEYMEMLATCLSDGYACLRDEITELLGRYMPGWKPSNQRDRYRDSVGGFSAAWLALLQRIHDGPVENGKYPIGNHDDNLNRRENGEGHPRNGDEVWDEFRKDGMPRKAKERLEKAQVFMLGKMIWCLFEGSSTVRCGIDWEILQDADPPHETPRFPAFRATTDDRIRELVKQCTLGAPEWDQSQRQTGGVIALREGRLVPVIGQDEGENEGGGDVKRVARQWWAAEVERALQFLRELVDVDQAGPVKARIDECVRSRPTLAEVVGQLAVLEEEWASPVG